MTSNHLSIVWKIYLMLFEHHRKITMIVATVVISIAAIFIRTIFLESVSGDMKGCLIPWFNAIKQNGGLQALSEQTGDYNLLYQTIIALLTYIPANPIHLYKAVSIAFDFALATVVARFCFLLASERYSASQCYAISLLAYGFILFIPTVFLNSSQWGQCDAIYSTFCIMSLLCLYRNRLMKASLYFGIALAFKLQAVFIVPFLCTFLLNYRLHAHKGFKAKDALLFIIPIMVVWLSGAVAYCYGRNPLDTFPIYFKQIDIYHNISLNCPNFWGLFITLPSKTKQILINPSLAICFTVLLCGLFYTLKHKLLNNHSNFLVTATWFTWTAVMLLPKMHERYTFMIDILLVLLSFTNKRFVKYAAISLAINTWIYYYFFTDPLFPPLYTKIARSVIYSAAYLFFTCSLVHASKPQESHSNLIDSTRP